MSKCEICGKSARSGNTIKHQYGGGWAKRAPKKRRTFKANIQKMKLNVLGRSIRINICTKCMKTHKKLSEAIAV